MALMSWFDWFLNLFRPSISELTSTGPSTDEHPLITTAQLVRAGEMGAFSAGLWRDAKLRPAHPGRVGGLIAPAAVVVHTTDMHQSQWAGLIKRWTSDPGRGECAHFLIGRTQEQGVIQFVPVTKNANHAGGQPHGWYTTEEGKQMHPNTIAVGIELMSAGRLEKTGKPGEYRHPDTGYLIPSSDVYVHTDGTAWQVVTDYQLQTLSSLLRDLDRGPLVPLPQGTHVVPDAAYSSQGVGPWAIPLGAQVCGHVSLDPINRQDPGPQVMGFLRTWVESQP